MKKDSDSYLDVYDSHEEYLEARQNFNYYQAEEARD